jgi:hypothetical protein
MTGPSRTAVIGDGAVRDNTGVPPVPMSAAARADVPVTAPQRTHE